LKKGLKQFFTFHSYTLKTRFVFGSLCILLLSSVVNAAWFGGLSAGIFATLLGLIKDL